MNEECRYFGEKERITCLGRGEYRVLKVYNNIIKVYCNVRYGGSNLKRSLYIHMVNGTW